MNVVPRKCDSYRCFATQLGRGSQAILLEKYSRGPAPSRYSIQLVTGLVIELTVELAVGAVVVGIVAWLMARLMTRLVTGMVTGMVAGMVAGLVGETLIYSQVDHVFLSLRCHFSCVGSVDEGSRPPSPQPTLPQEVARASTTSRAGCPISYSKYLVRSKCSSHSRRPSS